jgi:hypothetical protein
MLLLGAGICFAIAWGGKCFSRQEIEQEKAEALQELGVIKSNLAAANIPAEQTTGLLNVQKRAIAGEATLRRFAILSSLTLCSLIVASFGLSLILWSRLSVLRHEQRTRSL